MSDVKRYEIGRDRGMGVFMEETNSENDEDTYVLACDYIELEERVAGLESMVDAAKKAGFTFFQTAPYDGNSVGCALNDTGAPEPSAGGEA